MEIFVQLLALSSVGVLIGCGQSEPQTATDAQTQQQTVQRQPQAETIEQRSEETSLSDTDVAADGETVALGSPELTLGIPGEGPLSIEEIRGWHEDHIHAKEEQLEAGKVLMLAHGDPRSVAKAQRALQDTDPTALQLRAESSADAPQISSTRPPCTPIGKIHKWTSTTFTLPKCRGRSWPSFPAAGKSNTCVIKHRARGDHARSRARRRPHRAAFSQRIRVDRSW